MKSKRLFRLIVLGITGACLSCVTGCGSACSGLGESIQISSGEYTARINDLELWYKVAGDGPVCIHPTPGWGPSSELYYVRLTPLEELFTMVYLDTRGSGRSQRPELNAYTMSNFVADIEGLRAHLGVEKVWLMGHSDGGPMVLNYTFVHQEHVIGLILVDTPLGDTSLDEERSKRMAARQGEPWYEDAWRQWRQPPQSQEEFDTYMKAVLPFFFSSFENIEKNSEVFERTTMSYHASQGQWHSERSSVDLAVRLPEIEVPALIIVGGDDFICPPSAAEFLHSRITQSTLLVIGNAGHFPWLEQPGQFFAGIRTFLKKSNG